MLLCSKSVDKVNMFFFSFFFYPSQSGSQLNTEGRRFNRQPQTGSMHHRKPEMTITGITKITVTNRDKRTFKKSDSIDSCLIPLQRHFLQKSVIVVKSE